jgi:hypothetical protein
MAPPRRPEDLRAELELVELLGVARQADRRVWARARELVDERRLTAAKAAELLEVSPSTLWRRMT